MESRTFKKMDGGKNPHAKTERKRSAVAQSTTICMEIRQRISARRKFLATALSLRDSAGFLGSKIGSGRRSEEKFPPPTHAGFVLLSGPPFIRPWSGKIAERRGAFFLVSSL